MPGVRVLHGYTRDGAGDLDGYFDAEHLAAAMPEPDAVFVCGPPALVEAVRAHVPDAKSESFVPPVFTTPARIVRRPRVVHRQRRRASPTTAGRCSSRPRPRASLPKADAEWASATAAPAARPAAW